MMINLVKVQRKVAEKNLIEAVKLIKIYVNKESFLLFDVW